MQMKLQDRPLNVAILPKLKYLEANLNVTLKKRLTTDGLESGIVKKVIS